MHHLDQLEAEAIHVIREVAAELERPVLSLVVNRGPGPAEDVLVTETPGAAVDVISAEPSNGTCTLGTPVTCRLGRMEAGDSIRASPRPGPGPGGRGPAARRHRASAGDGESS